MSIYPIVTSLVYCCLVQLAKLQISSSLFANFVNSETKGKGLHYNLQSRERFVPVREAFKKNNFIFSDIVPKGWEGSKRNHYFRRFRNNDILGGWQLLTTYDSLLQLMTTFDNFWHFLTAFDNFWQLLTTFDNFWQLLTTFDKF